MINKLSEHGFKIIEKEFLSKHKHNIAVHESSLPKGRGWAPLFWQILEGKNTMPIVLFEALLLVSVFWQESTKSMPVLGSISSPPSKPVLLSAVLFPISLQDELKSVIPKLLFEAILLVMLMLADSATKIPKRLLKTPLSLTKLLFEPASIMPHGGNPSP